VEASSEVSASAEDVGDTPEFEEDSDGCDVAGTSGSDARAAFDSGCTCEVGSTSETGSVDGEGGRLELKAALGSACAGSAAFSVGDTEEVTSNADLVECTSGVEAAFELKDVLEVECTSSVVGVFELEVECTPGVGGTLSDVVLS